jgi:hypothetical protein
MDLTVRPQAISNPAQTLSNAAAGTTLTNGTTSAPSSATSTVPTKMAKSSQPAAPAAPIAPRLETQQFYDQLKGALSKEHWITYTTTLNKYLSGNLLFSSASHNSVEPLADNRVKASSQ